MKTLFLTGYGLSIRVKNTRLVFKQGVNDPFRREKGEGENILQIPASSANFDKVVIQGKGYVSTEALERLAESNINVIMLDKRGKLYSHFHKIGGSNEPLIRQKQYDCFRDEKKVEYLRKWIVKEKIESQIRLFEELIQEPKKFYNEYNRKWQVSNNQQSSMNYSLRISEDVKERIGRGLERMRIHFKGLEKAHGLREIMKVEADVGKLYYPNFSSAFRTELGFHTRNSRKTYRASDATNVVNGLLNFGFSVLYSEVAKQLNALGLDCLVGFYHKPHSSQTALVYDMVEPFRHLIDRGVFEIQDSLKLNDYVYSRQGIVVLSESLKRRYIEILSTIFDRKRDYRARVGIRRQDGYQCMEEITIMKMKCLELRAFINTEEG